MTRSETNPKQNYRRFGVLLIFVLWAGLCVYLAIGTMPSNSIPETMNKGELKWSLNFGTGYTNAPTPPIVHGDYVYVGVQNTLRKIDKETGAEVDRVELKDSFGYATAALTYVEKVDGRNVILAPISEGRVQAVDADTMTSLWITEKRIGYSCLSRVVYDEGYFYYGTWKSDTLPGMFLCYSAKDVNPNMPTEEKTPIWKVEHAGGFYWSEASVEGNYVLFGSEDGSSGQSDATTRAEIYSCLKGEAYLKKQNSPGASPVIDQEPIRGDIRCGVAYDAMTNAYYFTSSTGTLYKKRLNPDGTFNEVRDAHESIELGGATTGTPTLSQGKIYLGIQGPSKFGDTGHAIKIIDGESMTEEASAPTPGFVQSEMFITQSMEEGGTLYLYMAYNQLPGGIYVMEIGEQGGKKIIRPNGSGHYFTPPKAMQNYGISTLDVDEAGTLYYKNDSCNVMSIKKAIFK
jgi:outer membrane protein assembly factor BamB